MLREQALRVTFSKASLLFTLMSTIITPAVAPHDIYVSYSFRFFRSETPYCKGELS